MATSHDMKHLIRYLQPGSQTHLVPFLSGTSEKFTQNLVTLDLYVYLTKQCLDDEKFTAFVSQLVAASKNYTSDRRPTVKALVLQTWMHALPGKLDQLPQICFENSNVLKMFLNH